MASIPILTSYASGSSTLINDSFVTLEPKSTGFTKALPSETQDVSATSHWGKVWATATTTAAVAVAVLTPFAANSSITDDPISYLHRNTEVIPQILDKVTLPPFTTIQLLSVRPQDDKVTSPEQSTSTASKVKELYESSGLTWSQISRLFGVSRRSVYLWASGQPIAAKHEERLNNLLASMKKYKGLNPNETRSALLDSRHGLSDFQKLLSQIKTNKVNYEPLSPRDLIEA